MAELKNLQGQILLSLTAQKVRNSQGHTIAVTENNKLVSLQGQLLAEVESGTVFRDKGSPLLRVEGSRVVSLSGHAIAIVETGSEQQKALLAAAYLLFLQ